ncbi:MAG: hypothetical protein M0R46_16505 [Candidatus Muirbacterium halophilum]|nr:hypothetical protein [Candidatus Muirbacterium halophilum]
MRKKLRMIISPILFTIVSPFTIVLDIIVTIFCIVGIPFVLLYNPEAKDYTFKKLFIDIIKFYYFDSKENTSLTMKLYYTLFI